MRISPSAVDANIITGLTDNYFSDLNLKITAASGNNMILSSASVFWTASENVTAGGGGMRFNNSIISCEGDNKENSGFYRSVLVY